MTLTASFKALLLAIVMLLTIPAVSLAQQESATTSAPDQENSTPGEPAPQGGGLLSEALENIDYPAWNGLAERAEAAIEAGRASDAALESLRTEIVDWRSRFLQAQGANQARIKTIQSQIEALGAPPEEGVIEPAEVAERRTELNTQLARLRAPVLAAEEAYNRADGLIREIDALIRARQTNALFELGPSPLVPDYWLQTLTELGNTWRALTDEVTSAWNSEVQRAEMNRGLPRMIVLSLLALVLLLRGRVWARNIGFWLRQKSGRGGAVFGFLISVGQIILPLIGLFAVREALFATGLPGVRGTLLLQNLPLWGAFVLGVRWLAERLFSRVDGDRMLPMEQQHRREAKFYATLLGVLMVLRDAFSEIAGIERFTEPTQAVISFVLVGLTALMLFRIGQLMINKIQFKSENVDRAVRARVIALFGRAVIVISLVGPLLAAAGYSAAALALTFPAATSLALLGLLLVLQRFSNDLYRFVARQDEDEADSLITVFISFILTMMALPVLALIWGTRVADLTEMWARFSEGFSIGDSRISPTDFLVLLIVFIVGYTVTRLVQGALRNSVLPKTKMDIGGQTAIISGVGYVGIFLAAIIAITSAGLDLSSLAIVAGALSVGIGFGLQNIVSNFVSGIILLIERPIAEGDWIEVGGIHGTVRRISVRSTRVETFDRYDVIIPNADFVSGRVSNYTRGSTIGRIVIPVGVAYGTDTRKVQRVLLGIARAHDQVLMNPEPAVDFIGFGADSLDFQIRAVLSDINNGMGVRTDMRHQIVEAFAKENIEIPFAQRDVWLRNPETLSAKAEPSAEPPKGETFGPDEDAVADKPATGDDAIQDGAVHT